MDRDSAEMYAKYSKSVAEDLGHGEFVPVVMLEESDDNIVIYVLVGVPTGRMYDAVTAIVSRHESVPKSICICVDAYIDSDEFKDVSDPEELKRRIATRVPLEKRFLDGDPAVKESIHTVVMTPDSDLVINQPYKWTPVDGWEWDEMNVIEDSVSDWEWDRIIAGLPRREVNEIMQEHG